MQDNEKAFLAKQIEEIDDMPTLLKNSLISNGMTTVGQVIAMNKFDVKMLNNFGKTREKMLYDFLEKNNLSLSFF